MWKSKWHEKIKPDGAKKWTELDWSGLTYHAPHNVRNTESHLLSNLSIPLLPNKPLKVSASHQFLLLRICHCHHRDSYYFLRSLQLQRCHSFSEVSSFCYGVSKSWRVDVQRLPLQVFHRHHRAMWRVPILNHQSINVKMRRMLEMCILLRRVTIFAELEPIC